MTASFTCSVVSLLCRYHISRIVRGQRKKLSKCIMPRHLANKSSVVPCNDRVPLIWCHATKHDDSFFDHSTYARAYQLAQCLNPKWLIKHLRVRFVFFSISVATNAIWMRARAPAPPVSSRSLNFWSDSLYSRSVSSGIYVFAVRVCLTDGCRRTYSFTA